MWYAHNAWLGEHMVMSLSRTDLEHEKKISYTFQNTI